MSTNFVRVKDPGTGHEVSVPRRFAEQYKLEPLDKEAIDDNGRPLPGKPHVELEKASAPTSGDGAGSDPEGSASSSSTTSPTTDAVSNTAPGSTGDKSGQSAGKAATK